MSLSNYPQNKKGRLWFALYGKLLIRGNCLDPLLNNYFFNHRDPNSSKTLSAFDGAVSWASQGTFSQQDIDEAKLGVFQKVDMPVSPGNRGQREFLNGISDELRHSYREHLINVTKDDLVTVAQR